MTPLVKALVLATLACAAVGGSASCSSTDSGDAAGASLPPSTGSGGGGSWVSRVSEDAALDATSLLGSLCGPPGGCGGDALPGDVAACNAANAADATVAADGPTVGVGGGYADATVDAALGVAALADGSAEGLDAAWPLAALGEAGADLAALDASAPTGTDVGAVVGYACRVRLDPLTGLPGGFCEPAGVLRDGELCTDSTVCAAGLACVVEGSSGRCRQLCCQAPPDPCAAGSYCTARPSSGAQAGAALLVPVCEPADGCVLLEPVCESGVDAGCSCSPGLECTVVRDGTTSCVTAGEGKAGQPCPCAPGYFCSELRQSCVQICPLPETPGGCSSGRCQAVSGFPEGFGLCIGTAAP